MQPVYKRETAGPFKISFPLLPLNQDVKFELFAVTMSNSKAAIQPHTKALGIDTCANTSGDVYFIRSDLHCYMKCKNNLDYDSQDGQKYIIYPLHPSCSWGDHYLKGPDGFIIIKGKNFVTVKQFKAPIDISINVKALSTACQGGENYIYDGTNYLIIKGDKYTCAPSLTSSNTRSENLYSAYVNALYYYGCDGTVGIITNMIDDAKADWGVVFWSTSSLKSKGHKYWVYPDVLDFLPGGISTTFGTAAPKWELLKCFNNSSESTLHWEESISKTVGYNKSQFKSLEKNWNVSTESSMGTSFEGGFLVQSAIEAQFSLSTSFGGASIQTSQEDWSDEHTITEAVSLDVAPGKSVYIWQYRLGFAGAASSMLFSRNIAITATDKPPSSTPLPIVSA